MKKVFSENKFELELKAQQVRSLNYSQADLTKFPTHKSYTETVSSLLHGNSVKVIQWTCSMEKHKYIDPDHCHMCIKLIKDKIIAPNLTLLFKYVKNLLTWAFSKIKRVTKSYISNKKTTRKWPQNKKNYSWWSIWYN